jgi:hypothetical protein
VLINAKLLARFSFRLAQGMDTLSDEEVAKLIDH